MPHDIHSVMKAHRERLNALEAQYRQKAGNIVRFFDGLGMTTEDKIEFLTTEFATAYWLGGLNRGYSQIAGAMPVLRTQGQTDKTRADAAERALWHVVKANNPLVKDATLAEMVKAHVDAAKTELEREDKEIEQRQR